MSRRIANIHRYRGGWLSLPAARGVRAICMASGRARGRAPRLPYGCRPVCRVNYASLKYILVYISLSTPTLLMSCGVPYQS